MKYVLVILAAAIIVVLFVLGKKRRGGHDDPADAEAGKKTALSVRASSKKVEYCDGSPCSAGDTVIIGSYPQPVEKDEQLLSRVDTSALQWKSLGAYSGSGTGVDESQAGLGFGTAHPSDFMRYADFILGNDRYRAVIFDAFRPAQTNLHTSTKERYQDENGYTAGKIWFFKFSGLEWKVIDPGSGLVISRNIIDAQPFNNCEYKQYVDGKHDLYCNDEDMCHPSNKYGYSSLRQWLNDFFSATAFDTDQRQAILDTELKDCGVKSDKVFILSVDDALSPDLGFSEDEEKCPARETGNTEYARAMGLLDRAPKPKGFYYCMKNYWWLRSQQKSHGAASCVNGDGKIDAFCGVSNTYIGVRPAMRLDMTSGAVKHS